MSLVFQGKFQALTKKGYKKQLFNRKKPEIPKHPAHPGKPVVQD